MATIQKLTEKITSKPTPSNVKWNEFCRFLESLGYMKKPSSRGFKFRKQGGAVINAHKPHPGNEMPEYIIDQILDKLRESGDI